MNLSKIFPKGSRPLYYQSIGIEFAIIPEMNTVMASCYGFKFDAPLLELQFHIGTKALLTFNDGTTGFEFELPQDLARQVLERRNEVINAAP